MTKFYDGTKLLSLKDINGNTPEIYISTSNRSAGKTTFFNKLCFNKYLKNGEEFMILYRFNYELSECKTYYNCQLYFDAVEDGKIREVILNIKAKSPEYAYDFHIIPDEDKEKTLFTLTIPDIGD